jgi:hypothetical protein
MPFVNLDDQMPDNPKIIVLSDAAFRLQVSGLAYCNRHLTDGFLPVAAVPQLVPRFKKAALTELMHGRIWIPADGGYRIHDYLDWNRSKEQVTEDRERLRKVRSEAGKKGAQARWGT